MAGPQHRDTQHRDTQHRDTQHRDAQHRDTQHRDAQHRDTQHRDAQHRDERPQVTVRFDGSLIAAREGDTVAAALLAAGVQVFSRSQKFHRPRAPYCLSSACSHCLMQVDGHPNVRTCQTTVRDGMDIRRQNAFPSAQVDVLGALDWLFPSGMDHHTMLASAPGISGIKLRIARALSGLGTLPGDTPRQDKLAATLVEQPDAVVIGGGPAGMAAAVALAAEGLEITFLASLASGS